MRSGIDGINIPNTPNTHTHTKTHSTYKVESDYYDDAMLMFSNSPEKKSCCIWQRLYTLVANSVFILWSRFFDDRGRIGVFGLDPS